MPTQHIALALFLVLLAIGVIILISILVIVKRRIARRKSRIGRTTYNSCGHGLPKVWKSNIEKKINGTVKIRTEPQVFGPHYSENYDVYTSTGEVTFLYRAKTVDQFLMLKQAILSLDSTLEAPPLRDIRDFLLTARHNIMNPPPSRDHIEEYCQLYLWARHDLNVRKLFFIVLSTTTTTATTTTTSTTAATTITATPTPITSTPPPPTTTATTTLLLPYQVNRTKPWPVYSSGGTNTIGQSSSEQPSKIHKRNHSNFKINFPSFLFKATEHSQPRVVHSSASVTTVTTTILSSSSPLTTTITTSIALSTPILSSPSKSIVNQSRPTRVKVLSRTGQPSGLNLKRLSHSTHRKKRELLVSSSEHETLTKNSHLIHPSHVFTNDVIGEIDSNVDLTLLNKIDRMETKTGSSSHRRDSCQSDGSQTALIDLEPVIVVNQSKTLSQPSRQMKLSEPYIIQPDIKNLTRFNKGEYV
ncbi:unnamed protein product [Schistosoma margrebowiei]|uniref:Uncharacterized protein n=1 Tax=Schistosoma margrebowiei TaxID=48269 RepID=A0A183MFJ3_9TREM|nr:unnamed protein product [Schistosoma margrebowiei]